MTIERQAQPAGRRQGEVTLSGLRCFVAVAETQSMSAAAQLLGLSQPTVSIQLQALEQSCGLLLFHRKPKPTLTEAGKDLFVRARLAVSRVEEFAAVVQDLRDTRRGHLTLGLSTPHVAMPILAAFMKRFPAIQVATSIGNTQRLLDDITRCRIDVGIMTLVEEPPHLACRLITRPRLMVMMRGDDPLASQATVSAADLAGRGFVLRETGSMTRTVLESAFRNAGTPLRVALVIESREAMKEAVAAGIGLGPVFEAEVNADPRLTAVPFAGVAADHGIHAVALIESLDIPTVAAFLDMSSSA